MKKLNKIFTMLVVALAGLSLTACDNGEDLSTDQYGNDIALNTFGPCPVLRGGTLYFYGSHLDQINEIDLPGADPITSIEVLQSGVPSKISITVPAEKCDTGKVVLKTAKGGTITTITPITYREDIEFDKFYVGTEGNLVGSVGDVLTIKGDYLNLMHGVIFTENDTISEDEFISHDRYTITLAIPEEAKTGTITLTDLAEEPTEIQSAEALTVNLPEVTEMFPEDIKAGDLLQINGNSLKQIVSVKLNGATVEAANFAAYEDENILIEVPEKATDGEVTLVTKSGVEISAGTITTIVPSELVATPAPVKNGKVLTISGKDLDLITSVTFPNADAVAPSSAKAQVLTVTVPETAQEGDITLSLANGKSVTIAYTLVQPTVTSCTPASLVAGNKLVIRGTDLDLVASVVFPGDEAQTVTEFSAQSENGIGLTVPAASSGSGFTLNLKNGTSVNADASVLTIQAATAPAISSINPSEAVAGAQITITGKNFQNIQNLYIGSYKVTRYTSRTATEIVCTVPANAAEGKYTVYMEDYDGNKTEGGTFSVVPAEKDLASLTTNMDGSAISYPYKFTWDDSGRFRIYKADLIAMGVKEGSQMKFYKETSATGQVQINDANWGNSEYVSDWNGTENVIIFTFGSAAMTAINSTSDGWSDTAFILQGDLSGVTKITILP